MNAIPPGLPASCEERAGAPGALQHPPIGACLLDRDLRCLSLSGNLAAMPGLPLAAQLGGSVAEALPALFPGVEQALRNALAGETVDGIEIRGEALSPAATGRVFVMSLQPMQGRDEDSAGVLLSFLDVTAQRQTEAALEARTRDLEEVERIATLGSWTWLVGTQEFTWSDQLYRIFGRDPASFQPTLDGTLASMHPDDRKPTMERLQAAVRDKVNHGREFRVVWPDGTIRHCWAEVRLDTDSAGTVVQVHGVCQDITARKLTEEALREKEEHYRHLVELGAQIPWTAAPDGTVLEVGRRLQALSGVTPDETIGTAWARLVHPDDHTRTMEAWSRSLRSGAPLDIEYRVCLPNGAVEWLRIRAAPRFDDDGRILRWYGTAENVNERRATQEALRESEARFRAMFEQAAVGIAEGSLDGRWLRVNPRLCELIGYTERELLERTFQDITHPDDVDRNVAEMRALLADEVDHLRIEKRYLTRDGGIVWALLTVSLIRGQDGAPVRFIAIIQDISQRKQIEAALRESEEHYRYAVELSPQMPWIAAPDGAILDVGPRWLALTGLTLEETCGRGWIQTVHPDDRPAVLAQWARCLASGEPFDTEYRVRVPADGMWHWLRVRAAPRCDGDGRVLRWYGMAEDVHDRKVAQDALRDSEAFARSVLDSSPDCMKVIGLDGRLQFISGPGLRAMEIDDFATRRGQAWETLWPAGYAAQAREAVRQARSGAVARFTAFRPTVKGTPRWWDVSVSAIPGSDGRPVRLLIVSRDVTRAKQAQDEIERIRAEVQAAAERLSAVLESTTDGVILLGHDWRVTYVNRQAAALLAPRGLHLGASARDAFPEEAWQGFHQHCREARDEQAATAFEAHQALLDLWLEVHAYPTADDGLSLFFRDITQQRRAERERLLAQERLAHLACHDALTGLPNRAQFREQLDGALGGLNHGSQIAVLYLDLDGFKAVNDSFGHPAGDALLCQVADRLRRCMRQADRVARLGGDEFAVIQTEVSQPESAAALAQRLVGVLGEPYDLGSHQVVIGTSIGIALAPENGVGADDLIMRADVALYAAKAAGRGTHCFFEPHMDEGLRDRQTLKTDLRLALDRGELELYYQPVLDIHTGRIACFEALLRWRHPLRGLVSPGDFVPVAEETGLIAPIGKWVLRQACREAARWPGETGVAVNLSSLQFRSRDLVQVVARALAESGLAAHRLELEITESVLLRDTEANIATLCALKALGLRIAMDDFGTGYSSLSYLRRFPFDKIKIDRSFVSDLPDGGGSGAIVRAVVGLGASLGVTITSEGVETPQQLDYLRAEGCDQAQGYLFSRPVPGGEVAALVTRLNGDADAA
ncbi:PAS domain S-box protein [Rhodopila globiformis]|nr:PAS domain S-box protein [Rhodopila globiformis]